jgi:uncharacterized membrane protein
MIPSWWPFILIYKGTDGLSTDVFQNRRTHQSKKLIGIIESRILGAGFADARTRRLTRITNQAITMATVVRED